MMVPGERKPVAVRNEIRTRQTALRKVISSRPFGRGFSAYRNGEAFEPDAYPDINDQWAYERGRMFAAAYAGALRINRRLSWEAQRAASDALRIGALI
jgi:hypothetical protein